MLLLCRPVKQFASVSGCIEQVRIIQLNYIFPTIFPSKLGCILYKCAYCNQIFTVMMGTVKLQALRTNSECHRMSRTSIWDGACWDLCKRSYRNCFWYCSGLEQRRFGPVEKHFLFWSQNMRSIFSVLSETVATVSLSAPPTVADIQRSADISHLMSQMMLGISRLGYSCWWLVAGYVFAVLQYGICCRYYVTAEGRGWPEWAISCTSHTCIARRHRPHLQQQQHEHM